MTAGEEKIASWCLRHMLSNVKFLGEQVFYFDRKHYIIYKKDADNSRMILKDIQSYASYYLDLK